MFYTWNNLIKWIIRRACIKIPEDKKCIGSNGKVYKPKQVYYSWKLKNKCTCTENGPKCTK